MAVQQAPVQQPYYPPSHQTVIIQQPGAGPRAPLMPRPWTHDTFSCFNDCGVCCMTYFCPCIVMCDIGNTMGENGCCIWCCVPNALMVLRTKLRAQQKIQGTVMGDCCCVACCPLCVTCQMKRELNHLTSTGQLCNDV